MYFQIPANHRFYDHHQSFIDNGFIDWNSNGLEYNVGDIVYIYSAAPISGISFKCRVEKINIDYFNKKNDDKYWIYASKNRKEDAFIRLKLLNAFKEPQFSYANLKKNGLEGKINARIVLQNRILNYIMMIEENAIIDTDFMNKYNKKNKITDVREIDYNILSIDLVKHKFNEDKDICGAATTLRRLIEKSYIESKVVDTNFQKYISHKKLTQLRMKDSLKGKEKMEVMLYHLDSSTQKLAYGCWIDLGRLSHYQGKVEDFDVSKIDAAIKFFEKVLDSV